MRFLKRLAILVSLAVIFSCGAENRPLNILIIGVDTLRPDFLGCYGSKRNTSPNIDRLAEKGTLAENAVSQAPWTLPSFATVFTSLYPTQHGASTVDTRMRTGFPTLASILGEAGYATGAVVNVPVLRPEFGVGRGFEHYDVGPPDIKRLADQVTEDALKWIGENRNNPFFMFVHYFDPHLSYSPPAPYDTLFDPDYAGPLGNTFNLDQFCPRNKGRGHLLDKIRSLTPADSNHIECLYSGEIAFTDRAIGQLLGEIERFGLDRNTLIVFLSDHGEEFFDHGGLDHGHSLFNELVHVPLVFSLPGMIPQRRRIPDYVRLLDVTPTVLDMLGIEAPADFEGTSLKPLLLGESGGNPGSSALLPQGTCYSEALRHNMGMKSIARYPWKLIHDFIREEGMVFNIERDPGEKVNIIDQEPEVAKSLRRDLIKAVLGLSDTWFVEMVAGGKDHIFDLSILSEEGSMNGSVYMSHLFGPSGRLVDMEGLPARPWSSMLRINELTVKNSLSLAFKCTDGLPFRLQETTIPLIFDLKIDGVPAVQQTYLGEGITNPEKMPFSLAASGSEAVSFAKPRIGADPPYILIWHSESRYSGRTHVKLNRKTRRELRALGYIQ